MKYLIGTDIGTSGTKTVVTDLAGHVLGQDTRSYPLYQPQAGWAEQSRVPGVLGPDIRLFNGITLQGGVLTLTAYQNDSNVPWAAAFTQADGVWRLSSLTQQAVSDDGNTLLSVRVLRPAEGGYTLEEDGRTAFFAAVLPDDALDSFALKDWAPLLPPVPAQPAP